MKIEKPPTILLCLAALASTIAAQDADGLAESDRLELRRLLERGVAAGDVAGGVLLVAIDGQVVFREGFGLADIEARRPFAADAVCHIASMTKPTTSTLAAILAARGDLSLDDPVDRFLPAFGRLEFRGRPVGAPTFRQLLSHTAGLPSMRKRDEVKRGDGPFRPRTLAGVVDNIAAYGLDARPGSRYAYTGLGFDVVARAVEVATGRGYATVLGDRLLGPLSMAETTFRPDQAGLLDRVPTSYTRRDGDLVAASGPRFAPGDEYVNAGGGLYSTADDLARFFALHLDRGVVGDDRLVPAAGLRALYEPQENADGYALGFNVVTDGQGRVLRAHHGGASGTLGWVDFEHRVVGVVLTQVPSKENRDFTRKVYDRVTEIVGGQPAPEEPEEPEEVEATAAALVERHDTNGDHHLQEHELPARLARRFDRFDADGDGRLSVAEVAAALGRR